MAKNSNSERRNFFRITDSASLEIHLSSSEHDSFERFFRLPAQYQLISEFQLLDLEANSLLRGIYEKDRNIGAYLKILNRKIDALSRTLALVNDPVDPSQVVEINLSEGGLSFLSGTAYPEQANLLIKLILLPSHLGLLLRGTVLSAKETPSGCETHIEFTHLDDHQRQLIARHILRKQQEQRRHRHNSKT